MGEPLLVSVVAHDQMLEAGAVSALAACPEFTVVPLGEPAQVAVVIADEMTDLVLDILRGQRAQACRPELVLVAADFAPGLALHAIAAGARGLVRRRDADPPTLARAVLAAAAGDCTVPPGLLARLLDHAAPGGPAGRPRQTLPGAGLTDRERAVLSLIAEGRETGEIAGELCYSPRTVTGIVHDIKQRFRLRNRAHAVAYALRAGLL
jgi:DNA-binding NarL/FixJ family response regulator